MIAVISDYLEKGWVVVYRKTKTIWKTYTYTWWQLILWIAFISVASYIWDAVFKTLGPK